MLLAWTEIETILCDELQAAHLEFSRHSNDTAAIQIYETALRRFHEFVVRGQIPDDLSEKTLAAGS